jgi:hypothetical protein
MTTTTQAAPLALLRICSKHPELNGRRWANGKCPACRRNIRQRYLQSAHGRAIMRVQRQNRDKINARRQHRRQRYRQLNGEKK